MDKQAVKQLFIEAKQGDLEAFEQILFLYEKAIFNYTLRLVSHRQNAQDITQETFMKVYQHLSQCDENKNPVAWMYAIANNTAFDYLRKQQQRKEVCIGSDEKQKYETIEAASPYIEIERKETRAAIEKALSKIKPIYRSVLLLFYQEELNYQEIALALSLPVNTVKTYIRRGKQELKQFLTNV